MKKFEEGIVDTACPQADIANCSNEISAMEVETQKSVKVVRSDHHLVKISLTNVSQSIENAAEILKTVTFRRLKINLISCYAIKESNSYMCVIESLEDSSLFAAFDFSVEGLFCETKLLTRNEELDKRKVKLWRPAYGNIDLKDLNSYLTKYGEVDESYELRSNDTRKRTFVIAFKEISAKHEILKQSSLFIGKILLRVENYFTGLQDNNMKEEKFLLRISNIPASTTEFSVQTLMKQMKSNYWYIPTAKNGLKMRCIVASFASEKLMNNAKNTFWKFEGRELVVNDITTKCCFICGNSEHMASTCPGKVSSKISQYKEAPAIFKGNTWEQLTHSMVQKMAQNEKQASLEKKASPFELMLNRHEETKQRLDKIEEENNMLKTSLESIRNEMNENFHNIRKDSEILFKQNEMKIEALSTVIMDLSRGINSIFERLDLESNILKTQKTKQIKLNNGKQ